MNTSFSLRNSPNQHEEDELSGAHFSSSSPNEVTSCDVPNDSSGKVNETAKWGQNDKENEMEDVLSNQTVCLRIDLYSKYQINLLAAEYFYHRHFYLMFLPTILITMLSAIFAFSIKSSLPISEDMKGYIAFIVGCASIFNVFLQNLSNELCYGHRSKSHDALALGLKQLLDELKSKNNNLSEREKLNGIEDRMKTIIGQNDSNIPPKILRAYDLVVTRLSYRLFPPVHYESKDKNQTNKINRCEILGLVANEVSIAFNESKGWPWHIPDPDKICNRAIQRMMNELKNEVCLGQDNASARSNQNRDISLYNLLLQSHHSIWNSNLKIQSLQKFVMDNKRTENEASKDVHISAGDKEYSAIEAGEITPLIPLK